MPIPETLGHKMRQFSSSGRVVRYGGELFATPNWLAVLLGQEIWPQKHDPLVDQRPPGPLRAHLQQIRTVIARAAEEVPRHEDYIAQHCRAPPRPA